MKVKINVTQDDIDNGIQREEDSCAIALACEHETGLVFEISGVTARYGHDLYNSVCVELPKKCESFVETFDDDRERAKPFSFIMDLPEELAKMARAYRAKRRKLKAQKAKPKATPIDKVEPFEPVPVLQVIEAKEIICR